MRKTCLCGIVSLATHAAAIAAIFYAQNLFRETPITVIDFSLEKTALPEAKKDLPAQPSTVRKPHPPVIESKDVFPHTTKPDTMHPEVEVVSNPIAKVSEKASPNVSYSRDAIDSTVLKKEYISAKYSVIRDKVYRSLSYPVYAQEEGWQGTVKMSFEVKPDGSIDNVHVLNSSGYALLDNNAVKAVRQAAPFPYAPVRLQIVLPIVYRLE
ncbi:MAG: energy transducer TonB [Chitinivibrionales bacterium]